MKIRFSRKKRRHPRGFWTKGEARREREHINILDDDDDDDETGGKTICLCVCVREPVASSTHVTSQYCWQPKRPLFLSLILSLNLAFFFFKMSTSKNRALWICLWTVHFLGLPKEMQPTVREREKEKKGKPISHVGTPARFKLWNSSIIDLSCRGKKSRYLTIYLMPSIHGRSIGKEKLSSVVFWWKVLCKWRPTTGLWFGWLVPFALCCHHLSSIMHGFDMKSRT